MSSPVKTNVHKYEMMDVRDKQIIKRKSSLFVEPNKVNLVYSYQLSGINRHSNKRWYRWVTDSVRGVKRNPQGTIVFYSLSDRVCQVPYVLSDLLNDTFSVLVGDTTRLSEMEQEFLRSIYAEFRIEKTSDVYTSLKPYEDVLGNKLSRYNFTRDMLPHMREDNFKDFVTSAFGKTRVRKDLVKAAAGSSLETLCLVHAMRYNVPVDWLVAFFRNHPRGGPRPRGISNTLDREWANAFAQLSDRTKRNILTRPWTDGDWDHLPDIARMNTDRYGRIPIPQGRNFASITEIHDAMTPNRHRPANRPYIIEPAKNGPIELTDLAKKMHEHQIGHMTIKMAEETETMSQWSEEMNNCIQSYRSNAVNQTGLYGGVYKEDKLVANFEIRNNELKQLLGKYNKNLDDDVRLPLETYFELEGVDTSSYWGKPTPEARPGVLPDGWVDLGYVQEGGALVF